MGGRSDGDYAKAAAAVKAGTATKEQQQMNEKAAKNTGAFGNRARAAYK